MLYDFVEKSLNDLNPYFEPHWEVDHVCYRTESLEDYKKTKNRFSKIGYLLGETSIGGGPIARFEALKMNFQIYVGMQAYDFHKLANVILKYLQEAKI